MIQCAYRATRAKRTSRSFPSYCTQTSSSAHHFQIRGEQWWCQQENVVEFLEYMRPHLADNAPDSSASSLEVFYALTNTHIKRFAGKTPVKVHSHPLSMVTTAYPHHKWEPWKFSSVPRKFWKDINNRRTFFMHVLAHIKRRLGVKNDNFDLELLYNITQRDVIECHGESLLRYYSMSKLVMETFPEVTWLPWRFKQLPPEWWEDRDNRRKHLVWIGEQLKLQNDKLKDTTSQNSFWYKVTPNGVKQFHGAKYLLKPYRSVAEAVMDLIEPNPNEAWLPWKFVSLHSSWWENKQNQLQYINWLAGELGFSRMEDWYKVSTYSFRENHGRMLMALYDHSPVGVVRGVFPDHQWELSKFTRIPRHSLCDISSQRAFTDSLMKKWKFNSLEDWYTVKKESLLRNKGFSLLSTLEEDQTLYHALKRIYPEHKWHQWRFRVPAGWWHDPNNLREFFDAFIEEHNLSGPEDLYNVTVRQIIAFGGGSIVNIFDSMVDAIQKAYPEKTWLPWKFKATPQGYWKEPKNQAFFCKWVESTLRMNSLEDWYKVSLKTLYTLGGKRLQDYYGASVYKIVKGVYPNHKWQPWRFVGTPREFWKQLIQDRDRETLQEILESVLTSLGFSNEKTHWYGVTKQMVPKKIRTILSQMGGLETVLQTAYPEHKWDTSKLLGVGKSGPQALIASHIEYIAPTIRCIRNARLTREV